MSDAAIEPNASASRYELTTSGHTAVLTYRREGDVVVFDHTGVPAELEGQGVASRLVGEALADVRQLGLKIRPVCPFVVAYVKRHRDTWDLLAD